MLLPFPAEFCFGRTEITVIVHPMIAYELKLITIVHKGASVASPIVSPIASPIVSPIVSPIASPIVSPIVSPLFSTLFAK